MVVEHPEIHTRQKMNDQMRLIYSPGKGVEGKGGSGGVLE